MSDHDRALPEPVFPEWARLLDAATEAIDAEFIAADGISKPRWSRDLAIAALEAVRPHLLTAWREQDAAMDHCPSCAHRNGTCGCGCCAHIQRAVTAERERITALFNEWIKLCVEEIDGPHHPVDAWRAGFASLIDPDHPGTIAREVPRA